MDLVKSLDGTSSGQQRSVFKDEVK